ncbi:MAG: DUF63 family protein [Candidatus Micrarchaeota archaeon]
MDIAQFLSQYYIEPIIKHTGYNLVNTLTYAVIAILVVYFIFRIFQQKKIEINEQFVINTISFVLFGSTVRVITDSVDNGTMKPITDVHSLILNSHIYDYGFLTSSPGIYMVVAGLFLISLAIAHKLKNMKIVGYIGFALWLPHFIVLLFMMKYLEFALPIVILAVIPFYIAFKYFRSAILAGIVGAHALDGAATFFIIDYFGIFVGKNYFEQHVIPGFIGTTFGTFFPFYLLKIALASFVAYFIANEKETSAQEKHFITLLLIIIGLAPGLRDILRMIVGA